MQKGQRSWEQRPELTFPSPVTVKPILLEICKTQYLPGCMYVLLQSVSFRLFSLFLGVLYFLMRRESSIALVESQHESLPLCSSVLSKSTKFTLKRANKFYEKSQSFHRCTNIQKLLFHIWDLFVWKVYIIL